MQKGEYPENWIVVDHIIPGVTTEMLDWWWVNMEKGYELWCPDEHKGFRWEVKPPLGGHVGAVQIASESIDYGPVMDIRIEWMDPDLGHSGAQGLLDLRASAGRGLHRTRPGCTPVCDALPPIRSDPRRLQDAFVHAHAAGYAAHRGLAGAQHR